MSTLALVAAVWLGSPPAAAAAGRAAGPPGAPAERPIAVFLRALSLRLKPAGRSAGATALGRIVVESTFRPERALRSGLLRRDGAAWTGGIRRTATATGFAEDLALRGWSPASAGEFDRCIALVPLGRGSYRWRTTEAVQLGGVTPQGLGAGLVALLEGLELVAAESPGVPLPATNAVLDGLGYLTLVAEKGPVVEDGGQRLRLRARVAVTEAGRARQPAAATFFLRHLTALRLELSVADEHGQPWLLARASRGQLDCTLSLRGGRFQPLAGASSHRPGSAFVLSLAARLRKGPFWVGFEGLAGTLRATRAGDRASIEVRLAGVPRWELPLLAAPLATGPLNRTFAEPGLRQAFAVTADATGGGLLLRETELTVQQHWLTSWAASSALAARADVDARLGLFLSELASALAADFAALEEKARPAASPSLTLRG